MENKDNIGIVILAAGSSSRLGQPKQLLKLENETLIRRISKIALASNAGPVVVVLGSNANVIKSEIEDCDLCVVLIHLWEKGMSSSIKMGLEKLLMDHSKNLSGILFLVCDQPFVSTSLINEFINAHFNSKKGIVAGKYQSGTIGVPVLFSKIYFQQLLNLQGQEGARKIIKSNPEDIKVVSFLKGDIDIDTITDWEKLEIKKS